MRWHLHTFAVQTSACKHSFTTPSHVRLVYDMTDPQSLEDITFWRDEFIDALGTHDIPFIVVGTKLDLDGATSGESIAKKMGFSDHFTTSAKSGKDVERTFIYAANMLLKKSQEETKPVKSMSNSAKTTTKKADLPSLYTRTSETDDFYSNVNNNSNECSC